MICLICTACSYTLFEQVHIPLDAQTKQSKGLAYVTFTRAANAVSAYKALDRKSFQGRLLHILAAVDRKGAYQVEEAEGKKRTLKDEKNAKRKATASKDFNWSMLYMNVCFSISSSLSLADIYCLERCSSFIRCRPYEHLQIRYIEPRIVG